MASCSPESARRAMTAQRTGVRADAETTRPDAVAGVRRRLSSLLLLLSSSPSSSSPQQQQQQQQQHPPPQEETVLVSRPHSRPPPMTSPPPRCYWTCGSGGGGSRVEVSDEGQKTNEVTIRDLLCPRLPTPPSSPRPSGAFLGSSSSTSSSSSLLLSSSSSSSSSSSLPSSWRTVLSMPPRPPASPLSSPPPTPASSPSSSSASSSSSSSLALPSSLPTSPSSLPVSLSSSSSTTTTVSSAIPPSSSSSSPRTTTAVPSAVPSSSSSDTPASRSSPVLLPPQPPSPVLLPLPPPPSPVLLPPQPPPSPPVLPPHVRCHQSPPVAESCPQPSGGLGVYPVSTASSLASSSPSSPPPPLLADCCCGTAWHERCYVRRSTGGGGSGGGNSGRSRGGRSTASAKNSIMAIAATTGTAFSPSTTTTASQSLLVAATVLAAVYAPALVYGNNVPKFFTHLKTMQKSVCDGDLLHIKCPRNTSITFNTVFYGRNASYSRMCPGTVGQGGGLRGGGQRSADDTTCIWKGALPLLVEACKNQQECKVNAHKEFRQRDPCPHIRKATDVTYQCRPNLFLYKTVCHGERMLLKCQGKQRRLLVFSAFFGATKLGVPECHQQDDISKECNAVGATDVMIAECQGRRRCQLSASQERFGKILCAKQAAVFLRVVYTCVSRDILKEYDNDDEDFTTDDAFTSPSSSSSMSSPPAPSAALTTTASPAIGVLPTPFTATDVDGLPRSSSSDDHVRVYGAGTNYGFGNDRANAGVDTGYGRGPPPSSGGVGGPFDRERVGPEGDHHHGGPTLPSIIYNVPKPGSAGDTVRLHEVIDGSSASGGGGGNGQLRSSMTSSSTVRGAAPGGGGGLSDFVGVGSSGGGGGSGRGGVGDGAGAPVSGGGQPGSDTGTSTSGGGLPGLLELLWRSVGGGASQQQAMLLFAGGGALCLCLIVSMACLIASISRGKRRAKQQRKKLVVLTPDTCELDAMGEPSDSPTMGHHIAPPTLTSTLHRASQGSLIGCTLPRQHHAPLPHSNPANLHMSTATGMPGGSNPGTIRRIPSDTHPRAPQGSFYYS